MRDREDRAEEDREPVPVEIVLYDELDGMLHVHAALMTDMADVHSR